jgi:hypothetical protein
VSLLAIEYSELLKVCFFVCLFFFLLWRFTPMLPCTRTVFPSVHSYETYQKYENFIIH